MKTLKRFIAIISGKIVIMLSKLVGGQGSATAGSIARKIYPNILKDLSVQVRRGIVFVAGTNGKTTTNNMIYSILSSDGSKVVCNNVGANMLEGVITAFITRTSIFGRLDADYAAIEVDEASLRRVAKYIEPDYIVINNIFRDQLDRYGEIDITVDLIMEALEKWANVKLILNADDPLVAQFGKKIDRKAYYYGVDKIDMAKQDEKETKEGRFCSFCGHLYEYEYYHYSQLGKYRCPECGFATPAADFNAANVELKDGLAFDVISSEDKFKVEINYRGIYNIHNSLAAITASKIFGVSNERIVNVLKEFKPQAGRMEKFYINQKDIVLNLAKNPAGFNQAIDTVMKDERNKNIMIVINDNAQDGRDISWLWDVDFEKFKTFDRSINVYTISGTRKEDMALRLKYAGIDQNKINIVDGLESGVQKIIDNNSEISYALINYTALFQTRKILVEKVTK